MSSVCSEVEEIARRVSANMRLACAMATTMASLSPTRTILGRVAPLTMLASSLATRNPPNSFRLVALDMDGTVLKKAPSPLCVLFILDIKCYYY